MGTAPSWREYSGAVYFIEVCGRNIAKVGYSGDIKGRLNDLQVGNPCTLRLMGSVTGPPELEQAVHDSLDAHGHRVRGEWFDTSDGCVDALLKVLSTSRLHPQRANAPAINRPYPRIKLPVTPVGPETSMIEDLVPSDLVSLRDALDFGMIPMNWPAAKKARQRDLKRGTFPQCKAIGEKGIQLYDWMDLTIWHSNRKGT